MKEEIYEELHVRLKTTIFYVEKGLDISVLQKNKDLKINYLLEEEVRYTRPRNDKIRIFESVEQGPNINRNFKPDNNVKEVVEKARITFDVKIIDQWYRISVTKSKISPSVLFLRSFIGISIVLGLILIITIFSNYLLFKKLFTSFYITLNQLVSFDLSKKQTILFKESSVDEFSILNDKLLFFIKKTQKDYTKLKEFSENASHELQTPIAIIKSKLDLLQQSENLGEKDILRIEEIQQTLYKTSNLNRTLLLLNKIENNEFGAFEELEIKKVVESILLEFSEIIQLKELNVEIKLTYFSVRGNPFLIDLLLRNLIHNAIKHNTINGHLTIVSELKKLTIINDGKPLDFPTEYYFQRFKKGSQNSQSTGLGLAIVKQICNVESINISYSNTLNRHEIQIAF